MKRVAKTLSLFNLMQTHTDGGEASKHPKAMPAEHANKLTLHRAIQSHVHSNSTISTNNNLPHSGVILQGDFLQVSKQLESRKFDVIIADPPYNVGKDFGNDSDKQELGDYLAWTSEWMSLCLSRLADDGIMYVYGFAEILARIAVKYPIERQRWLVWHYTNKTVPGMKFWQRSHESILCLWKDKRPKLEVDQIREDYTENYLRCIGKPRRETKCRYNKNGNGSIYNGHEKGALPRDVLKVPALAGGAGRSERWFMCRTCGNQIYPPRFLSEHEGHDVLKHPTQKPMALTRRLILSRINSADGSVLIPFAGSGSECVVAQSLNIDFVGVEINDEYVEFACKWLAHKDADRCIA